jgi:hypothetical protein
MKPFIHLSTPMKMLGKKDTIAISDPLTKKERSVEREILERKHSFPKEPAYTLVLNTLTREESSDTLKPIQ